MAKKAKPELRTWSVPYTVTYEGDAYVEAESAEAARALVESGDFEDDNGASRVDWRATGPAREEA